MAPAASGSRCAARGTRSVAIVSGGCCARTGSRAPSDARSGSVRRSHAAARPSDLVERNFRAACPDALWVADFTYLRCWEGLVFFAFVIDAYSRRVVGWQFASHMRTDLVLDALRMALHRRHAGADVQLVHHSDAGAQYRSHDFQQALDDNQVLASIGSVGDAFDNAMAESFVDTFKTELLADRVFTTHRSLQLAIVEWVAWYNQQRLTSGSATSRPTSTSSSTTLPDRSPQHEQRDPQNPDPAKPSTAQVVWRYRRRRVRTRRGRVSPWRAGRRGWSPDSRGARRVHSVSRTRARCRSSRR